MCAIDLFGLGTSREGRGGRSLGFISGGLQESTIRTAFKIHLAAVKRLISLLTSLQDRKRELVLTSSCKGTMASRKLNAYRIEREDSERMVRAPEFYRDKRCIA